MPRAVASGLTSAISQPILSTRLASRDEISGSSHWQSAFAQERKDHRYYELLEDTLKDGFKYGYLIIESKDGACAI
ncbi:MAG: GNAT family N-acetyltransferase, partial [Pseudolabrys sp.]